MHDHWRQIILARQHKGQLAVLDQLRPVVLEDGVLDLSVTIRVARILDRGAAGAAPGIPGSSRPLQAISSATVRAAITGEETLMIAGMPAPTPIRDDRDRLVLLVETAT